MGAEVTVAGGAASTGGNGGGAVPTTPTAPDANAGSDAQQPSADAAKPGEDAVVGDVILNAEDSAAQESEKIEASAPTEENQHVEEGPKKPDFPWWIIGAPSHPHCRPSQLQKNQPDSGLHSFPLPDIIPHDTPPVWAAETTYDSTSSCVLCELCLQYITIGRIRDSPF